MAEEILAKRIKAARENLGITMVEAAKRLNLSKIGYCRYEYGDRTPSPQTLEVIANCFHTSVDYLIGNTDDISADKITIKKEDNPELFALIETFQNANPEMLNRVLKYYDSLASSQEKNNR